MTSYKTNRPWTSSFTGASQIARGHQGGIPNAKALDQVHKLARNFIVSLDLGGNNMKLVNAIDAGVRHDHLNGKERYLLWVKTWKTFYDELSQLIRYYKKENRDEMWRLKETAQVMLNARRIGKLASWAIVQRQKRLNVT